MLVDVEGSVFFSGFAVGGEFTPGFYFEGNEVFLVQHT